MCKKVRNVRHVIATIWVPLLLVFATIGGNYGITVMSENTPVRNRTTVIIDAGHGGEDGGAVSCTGVHESVINLQVATRLHDLMRMLGIQAVMLRDTDTSLQTGGDTIAKRKISDLKNRVNLVNRTDNCILISIHQNHYTDNRYYGAQVFYSACADSEAFAKQLQYSLTNHLTPKSRRKSKRADGVYLMEKIRTTGVLVECGFLSNPTEEALLRSAEYQKQLCCVIATATSSYLYARMSA